VTGQVAKRTPGRELNVDRNVGAGDPLGNRIEPGFPRPITCEFEVHKRTHSEILTIGG
jgi:hypothetical protein